MTYLRVELCCERHSPTERTVRVIFLPQNALSLHNRWFYAQMIFICVYNFGKKNSKDAIKETKNKRRERNLYEPLTYHQDLRIPNVILGVLKSRFCRAAQPVYEFLVGTITSVPRDSVLCHFSQLFV